MKNETFPYQTLRFGKPVSGAYYVKCTQWYTGKFIDNGIKSQYRKQAERSIKDIDIEQYSELTPYDPAPRGHHFANSFLKFLSEFPDAIIEPPPEELIKYDLCTNEWFYWQSHHIISALFMLIFIAFEMYYVFFTDIYTCDISEYLVPQETVLAIFYLIFAFDLMFVGTPLGFVAAIGLFAALIPIVLIFLARIKILDCLCRCLACFIIFI
jgi:hypothetical protein